MLRQSLFACLALLAGCNLHEPVGVVLVYEADKTRDAAADAVPTDKLVAAVRRRLRMVGEAQANADGGIEVRVYGDDPTAVRQRLEHVGMLEFRILARRDDERHRDVIELAEEEEKEHGKRVTKVLDDGRPVAKWVKVVEPEADQLDGVGRFVSRRDSEGRFEILVMLDRYNVTGEYFTSVSAGTDYAGKPCIHFAFNAEGAKRFGKFTGANLPDAAGNVSSAAIILDGEVYSAPSIRSRIDDRGEITGDFTEEQTKDLAAVLSAGSLPAPLRLVSERRIAGAE